MRMMWERRETDGAYRFGGRSGRIQHPDEGASVVSVLLIFHWDGVLFVDEDVFSDGLGIEVGLRNGCTGELLSGKETDSVVQKKGAGWWLVVGKV
jgi:hypothetical protein